MYLVFFHLLAKQKATHSEADLGQVLGDEI
jgi:hypothetical protein